MGVWLAQLVEHETYNRGFEPYTGRNFFPSSFSLLVIFILLVLLIRLKNLHSFYLSILSILCGWSAFFVGFILFVQEVWMAKQ